MLNWDGEISGGTTALEFLRDNYQQLSDSDIAKLLTEMSGQRVTKKSVKLKRQRSGFEKKGWQGPDSAEHDAAPAPEDEVSVSDNEIEINYASGWVPQGSPIKTLEDLMSSHCIDTEEWVLAPNQGRLDNAWTTPSTRAGGGFEYFQNHQVKARFLRRNPEPVVPFFRPIRVDIAYETPPPPKPHGLRKMLALGDMQVGFRRDINTGKLTPFHSREVLDIALQISVYLRVDDIVFGGDQMDFTECTDRFPQEVEFYQTTWPSLLEWHWWLRQFRELNKDAAIMAQEGNHDARLRLQVEKVLPWALNLRRADMPEYPPALSWQNLLALDALQIRCSGNYPDEIEWYNNRFGVLHGNVARSVPGGTARKILEKRDGKFLFFHIHTPEAITEVRQGRRGAIVNSAVCPGCACHTDGRVPGSNGTNNWTNGLAIVDYEVNGDAVSIRHIEIENSAAIVDGKRFVARDREVDAERFIRESMQKAGD
jgi:hypothetical protein